MGMNLKSDLSFEQRIEGEMRRLEAEVALALNYVRAIAQLHLATEKIRELEAEYEKHFKEETA